MSRPTFDELVQKNLAVAFDDSAIDGLNRNVRALSALTYLTGACAQSPEPDELHALLVLILDEQQRLLRSGVQKPATGRAGGRVNLTTV